ncbi:PDR/VanB family oxidoreductase [Mycobacterium sp. CVI_P3]|uniref:PDR/VanB family oxidoreductase n=1 Tax=Mycobacterium pinniadriaticum TaxID=2994102 RepID=A0ABT3SBZ6_9MYCO|nr:PDR/VanB family oxidoreductase [Mycobacterium pinniadriaticum]MCX2929921.1 PDR/VanB family oxidoreductase [Mycobacterium pinniadriaticum]MCX2936430.1 PDR/VanB family oxidoreductase [Mycobacterium pinniadriaticum]
MTQLLQRGSEHAAETTELTVRSVEHVADDCISLVFEKAGGGELPSWSPGAHIDLVLGHDLIRQYSLCGDPADGSSWRVGVLRERVSRGGSSYLHDRVRVGSTLTARGPRNHFPLEPSARYLFIAGGIGITPILTMVRAAEAAGAQWRLLYGGRRRSSMAFLGDLEQYGNRVLVRPEESNGLLDLAGFLSDAEEATAVYCCGPEPLIAAAENACADAGLPLHVERFAPKPVVDANPNEEFEVVCADSGITATVPADSTILAEVRKIGIEVLSSCSEGTCGTCETDVLEGIPDHRDSVLTPEERKAGESMMICVSRCVGKRLVLDL